MSRKKTKKKKTVGNEAEGLGMGSLISAIRDIPGMKAIEADVVMSMLYKAGVTPAEYEKEYSKFKEVEEQEGKLDIPGFFDFVGRIFEMQYADGDDDKMPGLFDGFDDEDYSDDDDDDNMMEIPDFTSYARGRKVKAIEHEEPKAIEAADDKTLVLRIQLDDMTKPPLWRQVEIPASYTFGQLHHVIQEAMGWTDSHLHVFKAKGGITIGESDEYDEADLQEVDTPVTAYLSEAGKKIKYEYDFGDGWEHTISVLSVDDRKTEHPRLLKTKGGKVVEDCGGVWGLEHLRQLAKSKGRMDENDRQTMEWLGVKTRPQLAALVNAEIDIDDVNEVLAGM